MIGRREFVLGAAAAGVLIQPRFGYANAPQPATNVNFAVPAGACDCHTHIHGDPAKFPWFAGRTYDPGGTREQHELLPNFEKQPRATNGPPPGTG
jgi:hypothetical protein